MAAEPPINPVMRLARAERDAVELHAALAEALRRLAQARSQIDTHAAELNQLYAQLLSPDLLRVLERTSRSAV